MCYPRTREHVSLWPKPFAAEHGGMSSLSGMQGVAAVGGTAVHVGVGDVAASSGVELCDTAAMLSRHAIVCC